MRPRTYHSGPFIGHSGPRAGIQAAEGFAFRHGRRPVPKRRVLSGQRGFTLLELLVVLVLLGFVAGMVGPRFLDMADRLQHRNEWLQLQQTVNTLPVQVRLAGLGLAIGPEGVRLSLPEGWRLNAEQPIHYLANGLCLGGTLQVWQQDELRRQVELAAPYCQWQGRP